MSMIILWDVLQPKQGPGSVQGIGRRSLSVGQILLYPDRCSQVLWSG